MIEAGTAPRWDPYDYEILCDPFPAFKRLRDEAPLYHNEQYGFYAFSRFHDCQAGFVDRETYSSGRGVVLEHINSRTPSPPGMFIHNDPPIHTMYRKLLDRTFTAPRMAKLESQIRTFCARELDELRETGRFDCIEDFSARVPMRVIGMLLGMPEEDQDEFRRRADERTRTEEGKAMDNGIAVDPVFDAYIEHRLTHPSNDLMSDLLHMEFEDDKGVRRNLTVEEVRTIVFMLGAAGNETTNKLIGWAVKLLAEHPDQRRAIYENRSLLVPAIEEVLRYQPPGDHQARYVTRDVEAYGQTVPEGSVMMFLTGAANRDERQFVNPDSFNIERPRRLHLTFGYGPHLCIGAALARIEGRIALDEMLNRFPEWDIDEADAKLMSTSMLRGWERLPVLVN